ncbi:hypothetical protein M8J75_012418 [Diaphorina citri]|nr:hypothetical protein M8J75_012418 [Diaphorina citri]
MKELLLDTKARTCGCKHAVAFVTWLHHKSSEPSVTEKECYWRRSRLSQAGSSKCLPLDQEVAMSVVEISEEEIQDFKKSIADELRGRNVKCMFLSQIDGSSSISIHHLILEFKKNGGDFEEFLNFCQSKMTESECRGVRDSTLSQSASYLWFEYRYGRVTASKLFEASRCTTENGTLVNTILGASKIRDSKAMERGRKLEGIVMKQLERTWGQIAPSGLVLDKEYPIFGASPDGVTNTHVVEIKCPMSDKTFPSYFASGLTKPAPKYEAQIMLQMLFCLKDKAIYSVAHPDFESSGKITTLEVPFDAVLCADLMERAQEFWKKYIFTKLLSQ